MRSDCFEAWHPACGSDNGEGRRQRLRLNSVKKVIELRGTVKNQFWLPASHGYDSHSPKPRNVDTGPVFSLPR